MKGKILIVEDEKRLSNVMKLYLEKDGYNVKCAYDGEQGENLLAKEEFDLIILDVMMPKKDGWSLLRKIKANTMSSVIMTTARGEEEDRIFGLELGADDYMVKPISMKELLLRVALRIKDKPNEPNSFNYNNFYIDEYKREVVENKSIINLTPKEFELILFFSKNPNIVFKRDVLLNKVWGYDFAGDTRTVDTHIKNLREKIQFCREYLKTIWGVGYKLEI